MRYQALTVGGHLLSLVRRCLTLCLMIYEILQSPHRPSDSRWRLIFSLPISTFSALGVSHVMRSINVRYLLTYLLDIFKQRVQDSPSKKVLWCDLCHFALRMDDLEGIIDMCWSFDFKLINFSATFWVELTESLLSFRVICMGLLAADGEVCPVFCFDPIYVRSSQCERRFMSGWLRAPQKCHLLLTYFS